MLMKKLLIKVQWLIRQKFRKELSSKNRPKEFIVEALVEECDMIGRNCNHCETVIKEYCKPLNVVTILTLGMERPTFLPHLAYLVAIFVQTTAHILIIVQITA